MHGTFLRASATYCVRSRGNELPCSQPVRGHLQTELRKLNVKMTFLGGGGGGGYPRNINTVKNEVCKAHQTVSIHTLFGEKCAYRDILVCMAHFSIYSEGSEMHAQTNFFGEKCDIKKGRG